MNMKGNVIVLFAVLQFAATSSALADPQCLVGKWQAEEEVLNVNSPPTRMLAGDWSVSGDVLIEILPSGDVRFVYDDYVVIQKSQRGTFEVLLEVRYHGDAEGSLSPGDDMSHLSLNAASMVARSIRQKIGGHDWMDVDEDDETPPHKQKNYSFACDGDELTLSKTEKGPFGGDYNGRFVRVD